MIMDTEFPRASVVKVSVVIAMRQLEGRTGRGSLGDVVSTQAEGPDGIAANELGDLLVVEACLFATLRTSLVCVNVEPALFPPVLLSSQDHLGGVRSGRQGCFEIPDRLVAVHRHDASNTRPQSPVRVSLLRRFAPALLRQ